MQVMTTRTATNSQAVAELGRSYIMARAWSTFRNTVGATRAACGGDTFAGHLRHAWIQSRLKANADRKLESAISRDVSGARGASHSEWGRDSYRYNTTVLGR